MKIARQLFDTEGLTLANLGDKTDRIPTLYAYFEENRQFYLVQEWIEGQTLTQELGTRKLSEAETLEIVRKILAVLTEVHTKRIVHRDLKPDNIIRRSRDRQLVLIDFGAVKAVRQTSLNATNVTRSIGIGTAGYMPSEQAMGYPTSASDIYAVGAIALQCLTGQPPSQLFDIEYNKFKDRAGAIDDMKQAARLYEKRDDLEGITSHIDAIGQLATWNVDEEFTPDDPK